MTVFAIVLLAAATVVAAGWAVMSIDLDALTRSLHAPEEMVLFKVPGVEAVTLALAPTIRRHAGDACARLDRFLVEAGQPFGRRDAARIVALGIVAPLVSVPLAALTFLWLPAGTALFLTALYPAGLIAYVVLSVRSAHEGRRRRLDREFPYFLDFLVMVKEAGATLRHSLTLYVASAPDTEVGRSMGDVLTAEAGKGGLPGALRDFADRAPSHLVRSTTLSIVAAEEMGARSTEMLRELAGDQRARRSEAAERAAESLKSKSTIPMVIMFMGAFMMILSGSLGKMFTFN